MDDRIEVPLEMLRVISEKARIIVRVLALHPSGIESKELSIKSGIADRSNALKNSSEKLNHYGYKIVNEKIIGKNTRIWKLTKI